MYFKGIVSLCTGRSNLARNVLVCYISVEIQFPVRMVKSVLNANIEPPEWTS